MRMLLGFTIVLLLAVPSHAYLPGYCSSTNAATDFAKADAVIVGQVAGFERISYTEKHKKLNGEDYEITVFEYFAKVKIGRVVTGMLEVDDEIFVFEGYGEQYDNSSSTEPHSIKQCNSHAQAGLVIGHAYFLALNIHGEAMHGKTRYGLRSCHSSIHEIRNVENEESGEHWFGVLINDDDSKPPHYVTTDAFLAHMKKRSESAPAK